MQKGKICGLRTCDLIINDLQSPQLTYCRFVISGFCYIIFYCNFVQDEEYHSFNTKDFVTQRFIKSRLHCTFTISLQGTRQIIISLECIVCRAGIFVGRNWWTILCLHATAAILDGEMRSGLERVKSHPKGEDDWLKKEGGEGIFCIPSLPRVS